jgi:sugar lactone lactonase YvrE
MKTHPFLLLCAALGTATHLAPGKPATAAPPASHDESTEACIGLAPQTRFRSLDSITVASNGSLVACDMEARKVIVFSPTGESQRTIDVPLEPSVVCMLDDDSLCAAGAGRIVVVGLDGKIETNAAAKDVGLPAEATPSGLAVSGNDVFVAYCRIPGERVSGAVYRLTAGLTDARRIASGFRGCCGNLAIGAHDGKVYIAENAGHRVVVLDREGEVVRRWGERSRDSIEGFGSCCNPMALWVDREGTVYTSESGPNLIKRFSNEGKFLGFVGTLGKPIRNAKEMAASCSNTGVAVNADGSRVYVIDENNELIRVLVQQPKPGSD